MFEEFSSTSQAYAVSLPQRRKPSEEEVQFALTHQGSPTRTDEDFKQLLYMLGCAGYGWLSPVGVKRELENMAADWDSPPPMPLEPKADRWTYDAIC